MFNMFALLLDDALKPATLLIAPLISGVAGLSASSSSKEVPTFLGHPMLSLRFVKRQGTG